MKNLVVSSDTMGKGNEEIGKIIMEKFLLNLCESDKLPKKIFFYNRGVFLCEKNSPYKNELEVLFKKNVKLLVCSTCIDFFKIEILPFTLKSNIRELIKIMDKDCIII